MKELYPIKDGRKICSKCLIEQDIESFYKSSRNKSGYVNKCKSCFGEEGKVSKKIYRSKEENKEKERLTNKIWFQNNKEKRREYKKTEKYKNKRNEVRKFRYRTDIKYNIEHRYRARIQSLLKSTTSGRSRTMEYLGCSKEDFLKYIESQFLENMSWDNRNLWDIDHIIPCCSFNLENEVERKQCFHYTNLRPLWSIDNKNKIKSDLLWKQLKQTQPQ